MGIQYGNITLHGVKQEELTDYLTEVGRDAYVSPNINNYVTIYDRAIDGPNKEDIAKLIKLDSTSRRFINQYRYGSFLIDEFRCNYIAVR